jgi:hypothetical protein
MRRDLDDLNFSGAEKEKRFLYFVLTVVIVLLAIALTTIGYMSVRMMDRDTDATSNGAGNRIEVSKTEAKTEYRLSQKDMDEIVRRVVERLSGERRESPKPSETIPSDDTDSELDALISSSSSSDGKSLEERLKESEVDTLDEKVISPQKRDPSTFAKASARGKGGTYNRVVISDDAASEDIEMKRLDDELEKLIEQTRPSESDSKRKREIEEHRKEMRTIVVMPGDTLITIAQKAYGDGRKYVKIFEANPELIKNPNSIYVGQRLRVPE